MWQWCVRPVEQRRGQFGITEHRRPFSEAEVGGDDQAGSLIELAHEVEQELHRRPG